LPVASQHPIAQEVASQMHFPLVVSHSSPAGQAEHVAPPLPHCLADWDAVETHAPLSVQHPLAHVIALQPWFESPLPSPLF
jgi:hypothetical protein